MLRMLGSELQIRFEVKHILKSKGLRRTDFSYMFIFHLSIDVGISISTKYSC